MSTNPTSPWDTLIATRDAWFEDQSKSDQMPLSSGYLLLPEVNQLIDTVSFSERHYFLLSLLWRTGARIQELLDITNRDFTYRSVLDRHVTAITLGQGDTERTIPLKDDHFSAELARSLSRTQSRSAQQVFSFHRQTASNLIKGAVSQYRSSENTVPDSINITANTLRASFATNAILHGTPLTVLANWLGFSHVSSTQPYVDALKLNPSDVFSRIEFNQRDAHSSKLLLG